MPLRAVLETLTRAIGREIIPQSSERQPHDLAQSLLRHHPRIYVVCPHSREASVTGSSTPGDEGIATDVISLPTAERHVLAAVAVVGRASLSESELADLLAVDDVRPLVADLEARGLIKGDERKRYSLLGRVGEDIRKTDDALATGDQLMQYMTTLAKAGDLTPARLVDDAQAILGLSEWAAENQQWASLLEFVKTLQACFGIAQRVQQWLALLERGRSAARALGDRRSEVWILQQMATAAQSAGDATAAQRYLREADELQRGYPTGTGRAVGERSLLSRVLWGLGFTITALVGVGVGYAIGNDGGGSAATAPTVTVTHRVTQTVNQSGTATESVTTTETTTTTVTETTTTSG